MTEQLAAWKALAIKANAAFYELLPLMLPLIFFGLIAYGILWIIKRLLYQVATSTRLQRTLQPVSAVAWAVLSYPIYRVFLWRGARRMAKLREQYIADKLADKSLEALLMYKEELGMTEDELRTWCRNYAKMWMLRSLTPNTFIDIKKKIQERLQSGIYDPVKLPDQPPPSDDEILADIGRKNKIKPDLATKHVKSPAKVAM